MPLLIDRIDHVVLNCRDIDVIADWYERVLGMRREIFGDGRLALLFGNQKINLRPSGAPNWETGAVDAPGSQDLSHRRCHRRGDRRAPEKLRRDDHERPGKQDRSARADDVALLP